MDKHGDVYIQVTVSECKCNGACAAAGVGPTSYLPLMYKELSILSLSFFFITSSHHTTSYDFLSFYYLKKNLIDLSVYLTISL